MKNGGTKRTNNQIQKRAEYIMQKGLNTAMIIRENGNIILANADKIRPQVGCEE